MDLSKQRIENKKELAHLARRLYMENPKENESRLVTH